MIFDEPTSALDQQTTVRLNEYLNKIKETKIIIMISYDQNVIDMCENVISISGVHRVGNGFYINLNCLYKFYFNIRSIKTTMAIREPPTQDIKIRNLILLFRCL